MGVGLHQFVRRKPTTFGGRATERPGDRAAVWFLRPPKQQLQRRNENRRVDVTLALRLDM